VKALVTGAAGFIGSTLVDRLLEAGHAVTGLDCMSPYYDAAQKRSNVLGALAHHDYRLVELDLMDTDVRPHLANVDVVFHLAGQPGVRRSWADGFQSYVDANIVVTQRLLEQALDVGVPRLVYASSSSVYGNVRAVPTPESAPTRPYSPYGVTKLAGELLCSAYAENFALSTVSLRYFTVYGPRQRPDMALHRMIEAALDQRPFTIFGDGTQIRDFTYVDDIVDATICAADPGVPPGTVVNAAGGSSIMLNDLIAVVEAALGHPITLERKAAEAGDVTATGGAIGAAGQVLGWQPSISLATGVARQVEWHRSRRRVGVT
jgi:nucleoside-diphosphate-sugar epimerase